VSGGTGHIGLGITKKVILEQRLMINGQLIAKDLNLPPLILSVLQ
jgi:hypothetical protein